MLALIVGIGVFVGGAGVAGLWYASEHGWDGPVSSGQAAPSPDPSFSAVPTSFSMLTSADSAEAKGDAGVEAPVTVLSDDNANASPDSDKPKPAHHAHTKPAPQPTNEPAADPFSDQH